jgi:hypothetical protein
MPDLQQLPPIQPPHPSLALRVLGVILLMGSVGLVSCQALVTL